MLFLLNASHPKQVNASFLYVCIRIVLFVVVRINACIKDSAACHGSRERFLLICVYKDSTTHCDVHEVNQLKSCSCPHLCTLYRTEDSYPGMQVHKSISPFGLDEL